MKAGIKLDEVWKNPKPYIAKAVRVCIMCGKCGKYYLTYRDQSRVIAALRTSTALQECGVSWKALELVNWHGYTMENMVNWPVETGFALRHKNENWYWMSGKKRVWFSRPGDAQGAWTRDEKVLALQENRKKRRPMGLVMVCCATGGDVKAMPNWLI